jgi:hypothetical protein
VCVFALGANAQELQAVPENPVSLHIIRPPPQEVKGWPEDIVHAATPHASHMVVRQDVAVETGFGAAQFELLSQSHSAEQFQVAIHGSQADFWEPAADDFIYPHCCGVRGKLLEFLQDHLPLPGIALESVVVHCWLYLY